MIKRPRHLHDQDRARYRGFDHRRKIRRHPENDTVHGPYGIHDPEQHRSPGEYGTAQGAQHQHGQKDSPRNPGAKAQHRKRELSRQQEQQKQHRIIGKDQRIDEPAAAAQNLRQDKAQYAGRQQRNHRLHPARNRRFHIPVQRYRQHGVKRQPQRADECPQRNQQDIDAACRYNRNIAQMKNRLHAKKILRDGR